MLFKAGNGGAQIIRRSPPLLTAWRSFSSQGVYFPVQDPAVRNRHARHLDVIPTLIARLEGLWLGPGGSWTAQGCDTVCQEFELRGHRSLLAAAGLGMMTLLLRLYDYYDVVLWMSYNT